MNERPPEPAAMPAPPPPPGPTTAGDGKASGGMRALGIVLALILAFGAAVMIAAAAEISDTPTAEEVASGEEPLPDDGKVYDGSESERSISTGFGYASGVVGGIGALIGIFFGITGTRGRLFAQAAVAAVILAAIALLI
jgi:hypothetical protein